jgi:hypothetical protein
METVRVCDSVASVVTVVVLREGQAVSDNTHLMGQLKSIGEKCGYADITDPSKAYDLISDLVYCLEIIAGQSRGKPAEIKPVALDVSLEKARALHRVWRALNDGDCPKCHAHPGAHGIRRWEYNACCLDAAAMECPTCGFYVTHAEIDEIEVMFAPAMDAAVAIFEQWRSERQ